MAGESLQKDDIMLSSLGLKPSFGFGDRIGLATPGHIAAVTGTRFSPVFAQQSVRENMRTGRTLIQVLDDAKRAVEAAGWESPWGADADHLKTVEDLPGFVDAGYTFFTVDPGEHVDNAADTDFLAVLEHKNRGMDWSELEETYISKAEDHGFGFFDKESLLRAVVKYVKAIRHSVIMYKRLSEMKDVFDFEVSIDETDAPTTALEHFFIANELTRKGVKFTSLAPRFIGSFEKGVDYIGDIHALDIELARHAAVTALFGTYKISLHSGSDKFNVYPLMVKHWGERLHVKTAGTSYLEALRTLAFEEPELFGKIWDLGLDRYATDRKTYHVSAEISKVPQGIPLPSLLDDFHAREILHVTFGSALMQYGREINAAIVKHSDGYLYHLTRHFKKHLDLLAL
jgi:hypothetical protein